MPGARPYSLANTLLHPLARMLPLQREQMQVYRLGERLPPSGGLADHCPTWEAVNMVLNARSTLQARVNVQRDFTLIGLVASSSSVVNGGFRAQLFDTKKQLRMADRGVQQSLIAGSVFGAGTLSGPFFLREPYPFDQPDSQVLVLVQNLETVTNTIQLVLYGLVLRFNAKSRTALEFPGGPVSSVVGR
jgi:hypothetical protein